MSITIKSVLVNAFAMACLAVIQGAAAPDAEARGRAGAVTVDCGAGDSLQAELNKGFDGMTFNVVGTCNEAIVVELSNIVIDGGGSAVINDNGFGADPALIRVRSSNVLIKGLTIQNSANNGILVQLGGSAVIKSNIIQNNTDAGINVNASAHAVIGNSSGNHATAPTAGSEGNVIQGNANGIVVRLGGSAYVFHNHITGNGQGISLSAGGSADIDGNTIDQNTSRGIALSTNAAARLSGHPNHGEANLIENNPIGLRCRLGGSASGDAQDFGSGNPGGGDHGSDIDTVGSCPISSAIAP